MRQARVEQIAGRWFLVRPSESSSEDIRQPMDTEEMAEWWLRQWTIQAARKAAEPRPCFVIDEPYPDDPCRAARWEDGYLS